MKAEFLTPNDSRWRDFLPHVPHDVYHLPDYVVMAGRHEGGEPTAFYAEADGTEVLIPLLVRALPSRLGAPPDWRDLTTPYGYPAPLVRSPEKGGANRCFKLFTEAAREMKFVSAFLRLHPLLPLPQGQLVPGWAVHHGASVYVDLSLGKEEIWSRTSNDHRRTIQRLVREGYIAEVDRWSDFDAFIEIYLETMSRVGAESFYLFSRNYFYDLRRFLPDQLHLCSVRAPGGEIASAGVFFACNEFLQYHLGGVAEPFLKKAPSKLEIDAVRWWGRERGVRFANLGGGRGGKEDSLFDFKWRFSGLCADFYTWHIVIDAEKYAALTHKCPGEGSGTFFPAYRQRS